MTNVAAGSSAPAGYLLFDVPLPGLDDLPVVQRRERPDAARPRTTDRQLAISERTVQQFWSQDSAGILGVGEAGDWFGLINQ